MSVAIPTLTPAVTDQSDDLASVEQPWNVLLWNDPVTLMPVVVRALRLVFAMSREQAEQRMLIAHQEGKAVVFTGDREAAQAKCSQLHTCGLQATIAKDS